MKRYKEKGRQRKKESREVEEETESIDKRETNKMTKSTQVNFDNWPI